jgi:hypothetical protein
VRYYQYILKHFAKNSVGIRNLLHRWPQPDNMTGANKPDGPVYAFKLELGPDRDYEDSTLCRPTSASSSGIVYGLEESLGKLKELGKSGDSTRSCLVCAEFQVGIEKIVVYEVLESTYEEPLKVSMIKFSDKIRMHIQL